MHGNRRAPGGLLRPTPPPDKPGGLLSPFPSQRWRCARADVAIHARGSARHPHRIAPAARSSARCGAPRSLAPRRGANLKPGCSFNPCRCRQSPCILRRHPSSSYRMKTCRCCSTTHRYPRLFTRARTRPPPRTESRLPHRLQYRTCMRSCPTTT